MTKLKNKICKSRNSEIFQLYNKSLSDTPEQMKNAMKDAVEALNAMDDEFFFIDDDFFKIEGNE